MKWRIPFSVLVAAACSCVAVQAQDEPVDPPSRVARVSYLSGTVSFQPGDVDDWTAATPNYPLTTGDRLWADEGARAELHIGSTAIRLASSTSVSLLNLDDNAVQISLSEGSLLVRIREMDENEAYEIDTPSLAVSLLRPGEYRIDTRQDGDSRITVRDGEAQAMGGNTEFNIHEGQTAIISGDEQVSYDVRDARPPDDWERWAMARDRREDDSASSRYISPEMTGYEDLDEYGQWRTAPGYGPVWVPSRVARDWAPYRYGHWAWIEPWGWTWIDDAPWGFAPFHYGRWVYWEDSWCWVPGPRTPRPVFAPALVAFVGGDRWSVSLSIGGGGGVAWFPLGPGEVYRPAYHVSDRYVRRVNVINVTTVTNVHYMNQRIFGGVTAVSRDVFVGARPVGRAHIVVPIRAVASAPIGGMTASIVPRRESVLGHGGAVVVRRPPPAVLSRTVVVRREPPPPRVSFSARQRELEAHPGRPIDHATAVRLRTNEAAPARQSFRPAVRSGAGQPRIERRDTRQPLVEPRHIGQPQTDQRIIGQPQIERRDTRQPRIQQQDVVRPQVQQHDIVRPPQQQRDVAKPQIENRNLQDSQQMQRQQSDRRQQEERLRMEQERNKQRFEQNRREDVRKSDVQVRPEATKTPPAQQRMERKENRREERKDEQKKDDRNQGHQDRNTQIQR